MEDCALAFLGADALTRYLIVCLAAAATACGDATGTGFFAPNSIQLRSDPGDPVGAGKTYTYSQANAFFGLETSGNGQASPVTLTLTVQGDESWTGYFSMPSGMTRVEPGTYPDSPGWHGARACSSTGSFTIDRVVYNGTRVTAIDLSFEQLCDGAAAALHGTIHWRSDDHTRPPGPVNPPPADLWRPGAGATPAGVNFVYLQSDSGDYMGQGQTYLYTPATATISANAFSRQLSISVTGSDTWYGDFLTMSSFKVAVGYYTVVAGNAVTRNPTKAALDWQGQGRFCNDVSGWFAIDHVTYAADTLTAIDLRFEQDCQAGPALHGAIHWAR